MSSGPFDAWVLPSGANPPLGLRLDDLDPQASGGPVAVDVQKCAKRKGNAAHVVQLLSSSDKAAVLVGAVASPVLPPSTVVPLLWAAVDRGFEPGVPLIMILAAIDIDFADAGRARLSLGGDTGTALRIIWPRATDPLWANASR